MIPIALYGDRSYNSDTIRKYMISGNNIIPGSSTIHFDEISKERIFHSIDKIRGIRAIIRENYMMLKNRLGRIPYLLDFYENGEIDPLVLIREYKTYQDFLCIVEPQIYKGVISEQEKVTLEYLCKTVLRCLLDEFANIGQIPKFEKLIATIRSREISASIILQSKSQLKAIYKDNADTIEGNCDTTLFLGGKEKTTLKEIAEILGKETIDLYNTSDTRGSQRSYGMNYQKTGKELMSQDEIAVMDGGKCILQVRGVRPFFSNKYDICKHKNYKYLSDYDKKNTFDIEKYLSTNLILKPEDEVELYQM